MGSLGQAWADRGQGHTAFLIIKLGWEKAQANKRESRWRRGWIKRKFNKEKRKKLSAACKWRWGTKSRENSRPPCCKWCLWRKQKKPKQIWMKCWMSVPSNINVSTGLGFWATVKSTANFENSLDSYTNNILFCTIISNSNYLFSPNYCGKTLH